MRQGNLAQDLETEGMQKLEGAYIIWSIATKSFSQGNHDHIQEESRRKERSQVNHIDGPP